MGVELVQEVHEQVDLEGADAEHHVLLRLGSVAAVVAPGLLPLHPEVDKLFKLKEEQCTQAVGGSEGQALSPGDSTEQDRQLAGCAGSRPGVRAVLEMAPVCGTGHVRWRRAPPATLRLGQPET